MVIPILVLFALTFGFPILIAVLRSAGYPLFAHELQMAMGHVRTRATAAVATTVAAAHTAWNVVAPRLFRSLGWILFWALAAGGLTGFIYGCAIGNWFRSLVFILLLTLVCLFWMLMSLSIGFNVWVRDTFGRPLPPPVPVYNPMPILGRAFVSFLTLGFFWFGVIAPWIHQQHIVGFDHNGRGISYIGVAFILAALGLLEAVGDIVATILAEGVSFLEGVTDIVILAIVGFVTGDKNVVKTIAAPAVPGAGPINLADQETFVSRWTSLMNRLRAALIPLLILGLLTTTFSGLGAAFLVSMVVYLALDHVRAHGETAETLKRVRIKTAWVFAKLSYVLVGLVVAPIFFPGLEVALDTLATNLTFFILSLVAALIHILNWMVEFGKGDRTIGVLMAWESALIGLTGFALLLALLLYLKPAYKPPVGTVDPHSSWRKVWYVLVIPIGVFALGFALCLIFTGVVKHSNVAYADSVSIKGLAVDKIPFLRVRKIENTPGWDFSWDPVPNAIGWKLERRLDGTKDFWPVRGADFLKEDVHHWTDADVKPGEKWYYQLRAIYNGRLSAPSDEYFMVWPDPNWKPVASSSDGGVASAPPSPVKPPSAPAADEPTGVDPTGVNKLINDL